MPKPFSHVPDLLLERYALGELASEEQQRLRERLKTDPALQERLDSLLASNAALLQANPPEQLARRLQDRLRRERVERELRESAGGTESRARAATGWPLGLRSVLAGTMVLALVAVPAWKMLRQDIVVSTEVTGNPEHSAPPSPLPATTAHTPDPSVSQAPSQRSPTAPQPENPRPAPSPGTFAEHNAEAPDADQGDRLKGLEPKLALFRKTAQGAEPLRPGSTARPGDLLRIGYQAGGLPYGAILSVDGNGNVTRHWPLGGDKAGRLEAGETLLPGAFELDAAPRFERFYLLVSTRAFEIEPVREALRDLKNPAPRNDPNVRIIRFDILKDDGI